jgi:uncharacterized membrane protein YedE/YeeE
VRPRLAGLGVGLVFGIVLSWSGMTSPEVIRSALLFEDSYLFLFFASAVATAAIGLQLLRRGRQVSWRTERPERRHIVGSLVFGVGWGVSDACPGPIATQIGQGIGWGLWTLTGVVIGVYLFLRRSEETEPATDPAPPLARGRSIAGAA